MNLKEILSRLKDVKPCGIGWSACCPAHDDEHPSLMVTEADNGLVLMYCHAECSYQAICKAIGISNIIASYDYRDENLDMLYQVSRTEPKGFFQRRREGITFINGLGKTRRVLYRLPELLGADQLSLVFVPEGEKDVEALRRLGLIATCNSGGAGKWRKEHSESFRGRSVVVLPDNDSPGRRSRLRGSEVAIRYSGKGQGS